VNETAAKPLKTSRKEAGRYLLLLPNEIAVRVDELCEKSGCPFITQLGYLVLRGMNSPEWNQPVPMAAKPTSRQVHLHTEVADLVKSLASRNGRLVTAQLARLVMAGLKAQGALTPPSPHGPGS
jgi:hypothetical protein